MFQLHKAARQGQLQVVNWLIEEEEKKIEECDKFQMTPLHYAAEFGHIKVTKFLIEKGANIEVKNEDGNTPLHEAVDGGHFEVVKYLIEKELNWMQRIKQMIHLVTWPMTVQDF